MQAPSPLVSQSPSLTRTNLSEIAARVVEEFTTENDRDSEFSFNENNKHENEENQLENGDGDFEFAFVTEGFDQFSPISADEIFYKGQIRPIFELKCGCKSEKLSIPTKSKSIRVSLRKLFIEDRDEIASEDDDDLEGIAPGTYCVWRPKAAESPSELRKKSNSTGSVPSKRWNKLREFLHRSNSEGKESFVFLTKKREEKTGKKTRIVDPVKVTGKVAGGVEGNGKDKRKSYLPYRQDLVNFFGNVNGLNRNLQHI
ncbi:hypothetical protein P3S68_013353 [Capsicum galapagoense]